MTRIEHAGGRALHPWLAAEQLAKPCLTQLGTGKHPSALSVMDPLSVTASAIAVATAALQSVKALYNVINGLVDAPHALSQSKSILTQTQTTLGALAQTLDANSASSAIGPVLRAIELEKALDATNTLCQDFTAVITRVTGHSTASRFSTRDKIIVQFNESKLARMNRDLGDCQRTITMVLSSITLYD
jgi:uncharacterized membrane protein YcfT